MRRSRALAIVLSAAVIWGLWGCGGNNGGGGGGGGGNPSPRLFADTVAAPTMSSADEAVWNSADSVIVPVSEANAFKINPGAKVAVVPAEVTVQAIKKNGTLFVRLRWTDTTFSAWPDFWYVTDTYPVSFTRIGPNLQGTEYEEDQAYLMFDGAPGGGYDVWGWKVLRTGGARMGLDYTYANNVLTPDSAGTSNLPLAYPNPASTMYISKDTSEFNDYTLYLTDAVHRYDSLRTDTAYIAGPPPETLISVVTYGQTHGWTLDQRVPGYLIDSAVGGNLHTDAQRGSLLDIRTVDNYAGGVYSLVMKRAMNTGYSQDMNMTAVDSVKVVAVIFNDQNDFGTGGTQRGVSVPFWIIF